MMGSRGLAFLILLVALVAVVPITSRAVNPTISNVTWTPWVPAHGEYVTVEADVSSPGGPPNVTASWCVLPPFTCIPFLMLDPEGDGRYTSAPIYAADEPFTGAHFNVSAVDPGNNLTFTPEIYVQFADTITVDATLTPAVAQPGESIGVIGSAIYQNNSSVPAKFTRVDFRILGTPSMWFTVTDGTGAFASNFDAPLAVESYILRITATNRTISGSEDRTLDVAIVSRPDLIVASGSLKVDPNSITAGQTVAISVGIQNRGTAAAGAFSVLITVSGPAGTGLNRSWLVPGLAVGGRENLSASWVATEGVWTVTILVDAAHQISEISESNNVGEQSFSVVGSPQQAPSVTLMVGVVMLGIGVAAAAAFVYRRRTGGKKAP